MFKNFKYITLFILVIILLTGCNFSSNNNKFNYELTNDEMLEDYDALWDTLLKDFPYINSLKNQGVNVEKLKETYRDKIAGIESFDEYFILLHNLIFNELRGEGHLSLVYPEVFYRYNDHYNDKDFENKENFYNHSVSAYLDKGSEMRYSTMGDLISQNNNINSESETESLELFEKDDTLIIDYNSFWLDKENEIDINYKKVKDVLENNTFDNIIFDLRGNFGGTPDAWLDIVEMIIDDDIEVKEYLLSYGLESKKAIEEVIRDKDKESSIKEHKDLGDDKIVYSVVSKIKSKKIIKNNPKIYIVLDEKSQSATLMFADFARNTGFAEILSRYPLNGGFGSWNFIIGVKATVLPKSNLIVQNYSFIKCDENGNPYDPIINPDKIIDKGLSVDRLLRVIK